MQRFHVIAAAGAAVAAALAAGFPRGSRESRDLEVQLCDGQSSVRIAAAPADAGAGRAVAMQLMSQWQQHNPERAAAWASDGTVPPAQDPPPQDPPTKTAEELLQQRFQLKAPFDNRQVLGDGQGAGQTYGDFKSEDLAIWERATRGFVLEGAQVFHDSGRLGSTISVSCDMCHPDAANTHPETYPKYQTQIGKAVLLRDMINWCLQHPVRAPAMADDDPRLKALEAYILAQRAGKPLQFGRH